MVYSQHIQKKNGIVSLLNKTLVRIVIFINHYLPICLDLPLAICLSWGVKSSSCLMLLCTILDSCWDHIHNAEIVLHSWLCPLAKIFLMFSQPMRSQPYDNNWPNRGKDSDILMLPFIVITWTQITTRKFCTCLPQHRG